MNKTELLQDSRFGETLERLKPANADVICGIVESWVKTMKGSDIIALAQEWGFPAAPVMNDLQIANDEWRRERGSVVEFEDEMYGKRTWPGSGGGPFRDTGPDKKFAAACGLP